MTTEQPIPILDDLVRMQSVDKKNMLRLIDELPEQCETALGIGRSVKVEPREEPTDYVLICGSGDSGLAVSMATEVLESEVGIPVIPQYTPGIPSFIGENSLVFVIDYTGMSQIALRNYREARSHGATVYCVASGGKLQEAAAADGVRIVKIPAGQPSRSAIGYLFIPPVAIVEKHGLVKRATEDISNAIKLMKNVRETFRFQTATVRNRAKQIAMELADKTPVICGVGGYRALIAYRWKNQIGINSKSPATHAVFPDLVEGQIAAWERPDNRCCDPRFVFLKEGPDKTTETLAQMTIATELLGRYGVIQLDLRGATPTERMMYGMYLGDYVSCYLALYYGVDPIVSESVKYVQEQMAELAKPPAPPEQASNPEGASPEGQEGTD